MGTEKMLGKTGESNGNIWVMWMLEMGGMSLKQPICEIPERQRYSEGGSQYTQTIWHKITGHRKTKCLKIQIEKEKKH